MNQKFKKILLKLSGESLLSKEGKPISSEHLNHYVSEIKDALSIGTRIGVVIGGGNIFRGLGHDAKIDRISGDYMGMMATVINGIALQAALRSNGVQARLLTAIEMKPVAERYSKDLMEKAFNDHEVVIFGFGTGNPFFTTDTAASLRAVEMDADILIKGTRVDGIYNADPEKEPTAKKYKEITFREAMDQHLKIMDLTAFSMCMDNKLPIFVFNMAEKGSLKKIILGENIGTLVKN